MQTLNKEDATKLYQLLDQLTFQMRDHETGEIRTVGSSVETRVAWKSLSNARNQIRRLLSCEVEGYSLVKCAESGQWVARYFRKPGKYEGTHSEYAVTELCSTFLDEYKAHGATRRPQIVRAIHAQLERSELAPAVIPLPQIDPPTAGNCSSCEEWGIFARDCDGDLLRVCTDCVCDGSSYSDDSYTRGMEGGYCDL